jgi:hypothetical protein
LLQLRGPKNEKDLILQWGLSTGRIKLDEGWDRVGMEYTHPNQPRMDYQRQRFKDGLFSIRRYWSDGERLVNQYPAFTDIGAGRPTGYSGPNPFATTDGGPGGAQHRSPFAGEAVPGVQRYPSFLDNVIGKYLA